MAAQEIESIIEALALAKGVVGVVVCTADGIPIRDTFKKEGRAEAIGYAQAAADLVKDSSAVFRGPAGEDGSVEMVRVRTSVMEIIVKASTDYLLVVIQDPESSE